MCRKYSVKYLLDFNTEPVHVRYQDDDTDVPCI
jgi:hypothetical protein